MSKPVDYDRLAGGYDRRYASYQYPGIEAALVQFAHGARRVLEVGCGTGHFLGVLRGASHVPVGLDASRGMLERAAVRGVGPLLRASAEALPFARGCFDRICAVHAFHHFTDKAAFMAGARRVLDDRGALLIVGLDPHPGTDRWWVYDYYPSTHAADREHYPATASIRELARAHGFLRQETIEVEHLRHRGAARVLLDQGKLDKGTTSQLARLSDAEYQTGIDRIRADIAAAEARGETLELIADLRIYATHAWVE